MRAALALLLLALPAVAQAQERRSAYAEMSPELRAMQDDDFSNPGMLWAAEGEALWSTPAGTEATSCADCHGAPSALAGAAARYPGWDEATGAPVDLEGRIGLCQSRHQGAEPFARGSRELLALETLVALQSRGMPITPDPRLEAARAQGETLFNTRMGQLNLSCASCHEDNAGGRLLAATIPQGHPTGYPQYRLEWQDMGGLHRRFDGCFFGIRAKGFLAGSPEYIALEAFLMQRAAGMAMEAPSVRP